MGFSGGAAVGGLEQPAAWPAGGEEIGPAPELPHGRVDGLRIFGVEREVGAPAVWPGEVHLLPRLAAVARKTPRSGLSANAAPVAQTYTVSWLDGSTATRAMRSVCSSPMRVHVSPPSVVL
jgi:hypothetical protein